MARPQPDSWHAGGAVLPQRVVLTDEQKDIVRADLASLGMFEDIFKMSPPDRVAWLSMYRKRAVAVYAAIKHATDGEVTLTQSFREWSRGLGLPW